MITGTIILPFLWIPFDIFRFADYAFSPFCLAIGLFFSVTGLWLFKRSHDDLGTNWSVSLEVRENHKLITQGVYSKIRHPMYASLFLYSAAQLFLLSNWIVGPGGIIMFALLYFGRVPSEEKMMLETFGEEYKIYASKTKRLIPHVW